LKNKPTIGLQIPFYYGYSELIMLNVNKLAINHDLNLIIYLGRSIDSPYNFEYQNNVVYTYMNKKHIDVAILTTGTLSTFVDNNRLQSFIDLIDVPIISMGVPLEQARSNILIDNKSGLKEIIFHMARVHHRKNIAFIKGPDDNPDAIERLEAYQDALTELGMEINPELIIPGKFRPESGEEAARYLLEKDIFFDGVVAANDEMAITLMFVLQKNGIRIPEDVSIAGFDNILRCNNVKPKLTTVKQPIVEMSVTAVEVALSIIRGEKVEKTIYLPAEPIFRESCGCLELSLTDRLENLPNRLEELFIQISQIINSSIWNQGPCLELAKKIISTLENNNSHFDDYQMMIQSFEEYLDVQLNSAENIFHWQAIFSLIRKYFSYSPNSSRISVVDDLLIKMLNILITKTNIDYVTRFAQDNSAFLVLTNTTFLMSSAIQIEDLNKIIQEYFPSIYIKSCYLFSFVKELEHNIGEPFSDLEIKFLTAFDEKGNIKSVTDAPLNEPPVFHTYLPKSRRYSIVFSALFSREYVYGLMLIEPVNLSISSFNFMEILFAQVSGDLRSLILLERNKKQKEALEFYNKELSDVAQRDELTGLYNRRGFMLLADQAMSMAFNKDKAGLFFYADMDDLKSINDDYGHDKGDIAIIEMSSILKRCFRDTDIIARLGGDEFTVFTVDVPDELQSVIESRVKQYTDEFNQNSNQPFQLSISIGCLPFMVEMKTAIEDLIKQTDTLLYEQKKAKKNRKNGSKVS
jgi:diguanylate cyclase (GGDEF)-like protein